MKGITYKSSGVDIDAKELSLKEVKKLVKKTFTDNVISDIGLFGGLYRVDKKRILVSSADGVGTKIKVAQLAKKYDTIGEDLVNHCVNDILTLGAKPLFFLDYFAMGSLKSDVFIDVVKGLNRGCLKNGCALIGGETAEMPDVYKDGDFDLAGFIVGIVDEKNILPRDVSVGDVIVALPSNGLHTNGYSLVRKLFFNKLKLEVDDYVKPIGGRVGDVLLKVHKSYLNSVSNLLSCKGIKAIAHITGGGITDNLPRVLKQEMCARIYKGSLKVPPLFRFIQEKGEIMDDEMFRVFNMGVGMVLVVSNDHLDKVIKKLRENGEKPFLIGEITKGKKKVEYI